MLKKKQKSRKRKARSSARSGSVKDIKLPDKFADEDSDEIQSNPRFEDHISTGASSDNIVEDISTSGVQTSDIIRHERYNIENDSVKVLKYFKTTSKMDYVIIIQIQCINSVNSHTHTHSIQVQHALTVTLIQSDT